MQTGHRHSRVMRQVRYVFAYPTQNNEPERYDRAPTHTHTSPPPLK